VDWKKPADGQSVETHLDRLNDGSAGSRTVSYQSARWIVQSGTTPPELISSVPGCLHWDCAVT